MEITLDELVRETVWLRRLARSLVSEGADDLAQDAYVIAHTARPDDGRPLRPWLVRVARNLARMRRRGEDRARARELAVAELATAPATPAELVARVETHRLLAGLVLELPVGLRDVVLLHYVEGLTSPEISNRLGLAPGTVRWRLKQAVDELRARLEERQPNRAWVPMLSAFAPRRAAVAGVAIGTIALAALIVVVVLAAIGTALALHDTPPARAELPSSPAAAVASVRAASAPALAESIDWRITGTVIDEQGLPAAGADVTIGLECKFPIAPAHARTDQLGRFSVEAPPRCRYWMLATRGEATARGMALDLPTAPVELILSRDLPVLHVVDADGGAPIPGAIIDMGDMFGDVRAVATSGADGVVPARDVLHASHVFVSAPGYVGEERDFVWPWTAPVTIALRRGLTITGRLVDRSGAPVGHWLVYALEPDDRAYGAMADATGAFVLAVPAAGTYRLGTPCSDFSAEVAIGERPGPAVTVVRDKACSPNTPVTTEVAVTVVDERGPVAGAEVRSIRDMFRPGHTDAHGRYVIAPASVWPGTSTIDDVIVQLGERASAVTSIELAGAHVERTIRLVDTSIAGVVTDHGRPVRNAWVVLAPTTITASGAAVGAVTQNTGPDGTFSFQVPVGDYKIAVGRTLEVGIDDDSRTVESGTRDLTLELP